jgi:hypothetical protein
MAQVVYLKIKERVHIIVVMEVLAVMAVMEVLVEQP